MSRPSNEVPIDSWSQLVVVKTREGYHRFYRNGALVHENADGAAQWVEDSNLKPIPGTENWSFSQPDWDEFHQVIRGNGPQNRERVGLRRFSYEQNAWVRQAVMGQAAGLPPAA